VGERLEVVASAVAEHYLPRGADDDLPRTAAGMALALADRLDTIVGYVGIGLAPTGSEDPYALRRAATGFVAISLEAGLGVPLADAIERTWTLYRDGGVELAPLETVATEVRNILSQRAEARLREDVPRPLLQAALSGPWTDLPDLTVRARALRDAQREGSLHQLAVVHERCFNLSRGGPHGEVDESLCTHEAEIALLAAVRRAEGDVLARTEEADYAGALEALAGLSDPVETFFDRDRGVLVMVDDQAVRTNRQALLEQVASLFAPIADFSVVNPADLEPRS
jgi:glycyl-tRNA synthetase beta chain